MSKLNLNLDNIIPPPRPPKQNSQKIILILQIVMVVLLACILWKNSRPAAAASATGLSREQLRSLALKMEDLDLPRAAVATWEKYIAATAPAPEKHAKLLFRLGNICQQGRLYEDAVSYYSQSEAVSKVDTLTPEIGRRTQECLEQLGLFSASSRDLQSRTDFAASSSSSDSPALAEIGSWKITRKDLERHVEQAFEQTAAITGLSPDEILKQKKSYMKMFNEGDNLLYYLQQFVFDQLLTREVREQKLREDEKVLQRCRTMEKQLLDSIVLEKAIGNPRATEEEARQYYSSHKNEFKKDDKEQPFSEVSDNIMNQLTSQKRKEAHQKYFQSLVDKYDVVFHTSLLPEPKTAPKTDKTTPQPTSGTGKDASKTESLEL